MDRIDLRRRANADAVAAEAEALVVRACAERARPALVLPAGATPRPLFARLRAAPGPLLESDARPFQLDEVVGPGPGDPRSFAAFLRSELLAPLGRTETTGLLDGAAEDPVAEIARHARALREAGGAELAVLGLGANGHVAFNEPGSLPEDGARVVELAASTREALARPGFAPELGTTLGLRELLAARRVLLLVTGAAKAEPLRRALAEPPGPACPASFLRAHPRLVVVADEAACSALPR